MARTPQEIFSHHGREFIENAASSLGLPFAQLAKGGKKKGTPFLRKPPKMAGRGGWIKSNKHMSPEARKYQAKVSKYPGYEYRLNGVDFDGFRGGALLDAKGPGYLQLMTSNGTAQSLWNKLSAQATRQRRAAGPSGRIVWHVAEEEAVPMFRRVGQRSGIIVVHTAP